MALRSHPDDNNVCLHGAYALAWIVEASQEQYLRELVDEGVLDLCLDLLRIHRESDVVAGLCRVLAQMIHSLIQVKSTKLLNLQNSEIFSILYKSITNASKNESLLRSLMNVVASLVSLGSICIRASLQMILLLYSLSILSAS